MNDYLTLYIQAHVALNVLRVAQGYRPFDIGPITWSLRFLHVGTVGRHCSPLRCYDWPYAFYPSESSMLRLL